MKFHMSLWWSNVLNGVLLARQISLAGVLAGLPKALAYLNMSVF